MTTAVHQSFLYWIKMYQCLWIEHCDSMHLQTTVKVINQFSFVGVLVMARDSGRISVTSSAMTTLFPLLTLLDVGGRDDLRFSCLLASFNISSRVWLRELARLLRRPSWLKGLLPSRESIQYTETITIKTQAR